jgi:hypothetical protein
VGRYGQAILTVVGTVVGAYFGYPQLGALIGSLAGTLLFPTQLPTQRGPALADLTQTNSTVGAPIMEGWGVFTVAGTIIHQTDIREVIETSEVGGGSGGPSQKTETPTYYSDWAVALVDCPDGPIIGVRIIWANGKPIYDRRPRADGETDEAFQARMAANSQLDEQMVVYLGTDDQEPDPTLEAFYGLGQVSAHKQLAYIVFSGWQHKPEDGNRIPLNLKIEVIESGAVETDSGTQYEQELLFEWNVGQPENPLNAHTYRIAAIGYGSGGTDPIETTPISSIAQGLSVMETFRSKPVSIYQGCAATESGLGGLDFGYTDTMGGSTARDTDRIAVVVHYNSFELTQAYHTNHPLQSPVPPGGNYCQRLNTFEFADTVLTDDGYTQIGIFTDTGNKLYQKAAPGSAQGDYWDTISPSCDGGDANEGIWLRSSAGVAFEITRVPRAPDDPADPVGREPYPKLPGTDDWYVVNGQIVHAGPWAHVNGTFRVLQAFLASTPVRYPVGPAVLAGDARYNDEAFWRAEYAKAVALGKMNAGLVYGVNYPQAQSFAYEKTIDLSTITAGRVPVTDAVTAILSRAGYEPAQMDLAGIADLDMIGYVRTRQMTARAALDPLRQAKFFDMYESGRTIRAVKRGGPIRHTFTEDELGVFVSGDQRPSRITTSEMQDVDLPRQVRLHYLSQARDYELGQQDSPARVDTAAVNDVDVEVPMVLDDSEAKQVAQVLWADAWQSRNTHECQISTRWQELEPTDVIAVPVNGEVHRCRILDISDALPSHRKLSLIRDDDGNYESYAVAQTPPVIPQPVAITSPANMVLLDIPLIRDSDNDPGFYAAMYPLIAGGFKGAAIYRSTDAGGNWVRVATAANAAITGTVVLEVPAAGYSTVDGASVLTIQLDGDDELSSITRAAMLAGSTGSNAAAVGADGRWELVQFQDVEAVGDRIYQLTTLLRGRRGTEHAIGQSIVGDKFVLLTGPGIIRVPLQLSDVGREYLYRAVGTGLTVDSADDVAFTGQGIALKPFSPVKIEGSRDPETGDWSITWIRRGRIGQTLADGTDIPLSEEQEDYEVVIRDADDNEIRVLSVVTAAATYRGDQQRTDFGTYVNPLEVEVYQISAAVGRGYVGRATLSTLVPVLGDVDTATFVASDPDNPFALGAG